MTMKKDKCLLCGKTNYSSLSRRDEEYFNGFCDGCIMAMKKEKEKKSRNVSEPYITIVDSINKQIKEIESTLSNIIGDMSDSSHSYSTKPKISKSSITAETKKQTIPIKTNVNAIGNPPASFSSDKSEKTSPKPKVAKKKFKPTLKPVVD